MKKSLLSLAVAAFLGLPVASALNAEFANVSLDAKPGDLKVETVSYAGSPIAGKAKADDELTTWQYVVIPLKVDGKCRGDHYPNFLGELKVHIYAAFDGGKDADPVLLDKEITYVEIPLPGKSSENKDWSCGTMNAGIFISPANASKILGSANKGTKLKDKLIAVAVDASFDGTSCMHPTKEPFVIIDTKYKQKLTGSWWKKSSKNKGGAELSSIAESPFAPFYAPVFPATKPLFGSAKAAGTTGSGTAGMGTTGTPADATGTPEVAIGENAETAADTTDDATPTDTPAPTDKKKKKSKKSKGL